jgi:hypothetical protein
MTVRFRSDIRQWSDGAALAAHLGRHDAALGAWWRALVLHHTVAPTLAQWRGRRSMDALQRYYTGLGWDSGPHLFIAVGSPRVEDDGIWQLTALSERGIHANRCNPYSVGIEVVGSYDRLSWSVPMRRMVYDVLVQLQRWQRRPITIIGHRDCGSPKSCPGRAIDLDVVRADVARLL